MNSSQENCLLLSLCPDFRRKSSKLLETRNNSCFCFYLGEENTKLQKTLKTKRNISDSFNQPIRTFTSCLRYSFSPLLRWKFCSFNRMLCHTGRKLGGYFLRGEWSSVLELLYIRTESNLKAQSLLLLVRNRETLYLFVFSTIILMPYNTSNTQT